MTTTTRMTRWQISLQSKQLSPRDHQDQTISIYPFPSSNYQLQHSTFLPHTYINVDQPLLGAIPSQFRSLPPLLLDFALISILPVLPIHISHLYLLYHSLSNLSFNTLPHIKLREKRTSPTRFVVNSLELPHIILKMKLCPEFDYPINVKDANHILSILPLRNIEGGEGKSQNRSLLVELVDLVDQLDPKSSTLYAK